MSRNVLMFLCVVSVFISCTPNSGPVVHKEASRIIDWSSRIIQSRDSVIKNDSLYNTEVKNWMDDKEIAADKELLGKVLFIQAKIFNWTGKDSLANVGFEKSMSILQNFETANAAILADGYFSLGLSQYNKGFVNASNEIMARSIYYVNKYYDKDTVVAKNALQTYQAFGGLNRVLGNDTIALQYLKKALPLSIKWNKPAVAILCYGELASVYSNMNMYDSAIANMKRAEALALETNKKIGYVYNHFAEVYFNAEKYEEALNCLQKQYQAGYTPDTIGYHINLSEVYFKLHHPNLAKPHIEYLENGLSTFGEEVAQMAAISITHYYLQTRNYEKATEYLALFEEKTKDYYSSEKALYSSDLTKKYELKEKEDRIEVLHEDKVAITNKLEQRNYWILLFTVLLTALIAIVIAIILKQKNKKIIYEGKLRQMEDTLLRSQMEPHFVYNAMSSLQGLILENRNRESANYLAKFARLLRLSLEHSRKKYVPFEEEKEAIDSYLQLQKLRFGNLFSYTIEDSMLEGNDICVPPLMIQPFVENAIYHGFSGIDYAGVLSIRFSLDNDFVQCTIKDNGIGLHQKSNHQNKEKSSLSTIITKERLQALTNHKNIGGLVEIQSNKGNEKGTTVILKMPFIKD